MRWRPKVQDEFVRWGPWVGLAAVLVILALYVLQLTRVLPLHFRDDPMSSSAPKLYPDGRIFWGAVVLTGLLWYFKPPWRTRRPGTCKACGYDRTGLAPDAVCPECGPPQSPREAHEQTLLYSDSEVTNPGYPGALLVLAIPLTLLGVVSVLGNVLHRNPVGGAFFAFILLIPGVALIFKSVRARRVHRRGAHICPECGYDRSGIDPLVKCRECGTTRTASAT